jgi:hypothetical protein
VDHNLKQETEGTRKQREESPAIIEELMNGCREQIDLKSLRTGAGSDGSLPLK